MIAVALGILSLGAALFPENSENTHSPSRLTGRDIYIACALLREPPPFSSQGRGRFSYDGCIWTVLPALMNHAAIGNVPFHGQPEDLRFCLPANSTVSVENLEPLILAYMRQFEANGRRFADREARAAFLDALALEWPCAR